MGRAIHCAPQGFVISGVMEIYSGWAIRLSKSFMATERLDGEVSFGELSSVLAFCGKRERKIAPFDCSLGGKGVQMVKWFWLYGTYMKFEGLECSLVVEIHPGHKL